MKYVALSVETGTEEPDHLMEIGLAVGDLAAPNEDGVLCGRVVFVPDKFVVSPSHFHGRVELMSEIVTVLASDWWQEGREKGYTYAAVASDQPEALTPWHTVYTLEAGGPVALRCALDLLGIDWKNEKLTAASPFAAFELGILMHKGLLQSSEETMSIAKELTALVTKEAVEGYPAIKFYKTVIDPSVFYLRPDDEKLPDLDVCLERAEVTPVGTRSGIGYALDVHRLIQDHFG
jgi:hypothetical protein